MVVGFLLRVGIRPGGACRGTVLLFGIGIPRSLLRSFFLFHGHWSEKAGPEML